METDWEIVPTRSLAQGDIIRPMNGRGPFSMVTIVTDGEVTTEPCTVGGVDELEDCRLPRRDGCENTFRRAGGLYVPRLVVR